VRVVLPMLDFMIRDIQLESTEFHAISSPWVS
jgi:hypothetical protein